MLDATVTGPVTVTKRVDQAMITAKLLRCIATLHDTECFIDYRTRMDLHEMHPERAVVMISDLSLLFSKAVLLCSLFKIVIRLKSAVHKLGVRLQCETSKTL